MIISIIGGLCAGKSHLLTSIMKSLGEPERINFGTNFKCTKFNDILVLGQYKEGALSDADSWKYSSIAKGVFENFINFKVKEYRHIIFEGDRLTSKVKFLKENFNTTVFMLMIDPAQEQIRRDAKRKKQTAKLAKSRHTQMKKLQMHDSLKEHIKIRENNNLEQARIIQTEIIELLQKNT